MDEDEDIGEGSWVGCWPRPRPLRDTRCGVGVVGRCVIFGVVDLGVDRDRAMPDTGDPVIDAEDDRDRVTGERYAISLVFMIFVCVCFCLFDGDGVPGISLISSSR